MRRRQMVACHRNNDAIAMPGIESREEVHRRGRREVPLCKTPREKRRNGPRWGCRIADRERLVPEAVLGLSLRLQPRDRALIVEPGGLWLGYGGVEAAADEEEEEAEPGRVEKLTLRKKRSGPGG